MNIQTYKLNCNIHVHNDVPKNGTVHRFDNSWQYANKPLLINTVDNLRMLLDKRDSNLWHIGLDRQRLVYTHANQT